MRMSTTARSGCSPFDGGEQLLGVAEGGDHLVAAVSEQAGEAFAQQCLVFGDHDAHGNSAMSVVPLPCRLSMVRVPPWAATRSDEAGQPRAVACGGAADAVVDDGDDEPAAGSWAARARSWWRGRA